MKLEDDQYYNFHIQTVAERYALDNLSLKIFSNFEFELNYNEWYKSSPFIFRIILK